MKPSMKGIITMRTWKKMRSGMCSTPGRTKGENCKASPMQKWLAKAARSYKHKRYAAMCEKFRRMNKAQVGK